MSGSRKLRQLPYNRRWTRRVATAQLCKLPICNCNRHDRSCGNNKQLCIQTSIFKWTRALCERRRRTRSAGTAAQPQLSASQTGQPATQAGPNLGSNSLNSTLQLSYDVDLFARLANIRAAREQLRFRELDVERQAEQLRFDVTDAYYNLQDADGQVAIRQASVRNAQQSLRDAEALERAGVGTRFAVLQAQANLANEQQQLANARRDQRIRQRQLAEELNVSQSSNLTAGDPVEQAGSWKMSLEESIVQAFKNRAELEQQLVQRDISKQQRRSIFCGRLPQLSVSGSYNVLGQDPDDPNPFAARGGRTAMRSGRV